MSVSELRGCCIIENDKNDETLLVWAFPSITKQQQQYSLKKFQGVKSQNHSFAFAKFHKEWCYINLVQALVADNLPQINLFGLIIWTKDYNPRKYETLCKLLSRKYSKTGNPTAVLQLYLSVLTKGVCITEENGMFITADFESKKIVGNSQIKDLIKLFGLETILIYTALLLNKRLIIYHHSLENLLKWIQTIPNLMVHRNLDDVIFPWISFENNELVELKSCHGFIAGCTENGIGELNDLYDIFVNIPAREVTISPHSKDYFVMTKTHKDIALFMVQLSENIYLEEQQVINEIGKKTQELVSQLKSLASKITAEGQKVVSIETLREKNIPPALENFLFNLTVAEKMILL